MTAPSTSPLPRLGQASAGIAALGAATLAYAWKIERNAFTLREAAIPVLAPGTADLRILHLSDLHLDPRRRVLIDWVRGLVSLRPDLVVATGDFLAGLDAVPSVVEALEPLLDLPGMFVPGNADYFAPTPKSPTRYFTQRPRHGAPLPWPDLAGKLAARGWWDLTHQRDTYTVNGTAIEARGVDDPYLRKDRYQRVQGAGNPGAAVRLGLLHAPEPRVLDPMTRDGVDLILAGHTHGGQIRIPGYGALTTNCCIDRKRARGLHGWSTETRESWLHVSAGLGTSPYMPIRFCCRPEATLLTLTSGTPGKSRVPRR